MFDWDFIEPYQTPLETLQEMQIMRGKRGPYDKNSLGGGVGGSATKVIPEHIISNEQREREREQHVATALPPPSSSSFAAMPGQSGRVATVGAGQAAFHPQRSAIIQVGGED